MATSSVSGSATLSSAGIGSGLDVENIISRLMTVESAPLTLLRNQSTSLNAKLSSFGKLQSNFSAMRDKANALTSTTLWNSTTATSGDTSVVKASTSASTAAAAGNYAVTVSRLATGQTLTSGALPAGSTLSAGTLTIELGTWTGGTPASGSTPATPPTGFEAKSGSTAITVNIADGETSLSAVRDKINAAGGGVVATIVTDSSGARLSLRSRETGAENAFRISASETADDGNAATGLSALAFDATDPGSPMSRTTEAMNAEASINGIAVSSASNTLSNVVDGLTLTLQKVSSTPVSVDVAADTAAIKTAVTDFVTAFNAVASFIRTQTAYNADSKTGGDLQGDSGALSIQAQLRAVINQGSGASSVFGRLSDVGIAMKADGTLETSATKLDNALGNLEELKKVLVTDGTSTADSGFIRRFKELADAALGSDGVFDSRTAGLRSSVTRNEKSQEAMQNRLQLTEARLRRQYSALDTTMSQMSTLSSYLTQQITAFNKS